MLHIYNILVPQEGKLIFTITTLLLFLFIYPCIGIILQSLMYKKNLKKQKDFHNNYPKSGNNKNSPFGIL